MRMTLALDGGRRPRGVLRLDGVAPGLGDRERLAGPIPRPRRWAARAEAASARAQELRRGLRGAPGQGPRWQAHAGIVWTSAWGALAGAARGVASLVPLLPPGPVAWWGRGRALATRAGTAVVRDVHGWPARLLVLQLRLRRRLGARLGNRAVRKAGRD